MKIAFIRIIGLLTLFCLTGFGLSAQDVIHKKSGEVVQARVIELGVGEIKYRLFDQPDSPIYVVEKESIVKIIFQDGHTEFYGTTRMDASELFAGQRDKNVKVSFLGPLLGYTNILYEQNIRPGRSWEVKASIVGLGRQFDDHARGFTGSFAYKFYKKPSFYTNDMKRTHLLQGAYVKPEIFMGHMRYDEVDFDYPNGNVRKRVDNTSVGLLLNVGKQWVFDDAFVLDFSAGIGYGSGNSRRSFYSSGESGLAGTIGFNIGWMIR